MVWHAGTYRKCIAAAGTLPYLFAQYAHLISTLMSVLLWPTSYIEGKQQVCVDKGSDNMLGLVALS